MTKSKTPARIEAVPGGEGPLHGGGSVIVDPATGRTIPNLDDEAMAARHRIAADPAPADTAETPTEEKP